MVVIFSDDGRVCSDQHRQGPPRVDKPLSQLTNEEFRTRFTGSQAVYGTYSRVRRSTHQKCDRRTESKQRGHAADERVHD